jgi:hypothetical protein
MAALFFLAGCRFDSRTTPMQPEPGASSLDAIFARAVIQYRKALHAGLRLDEAGAGIGPISHTALFGEYAHVFYLPEEAEPLLDATALSFLQRKIAGQDNDEAALAAVCLKILRSDRKLARAGKEFVEYGVFRGFFVVYHYD